MKAKTKKTVKLMLRLIKRGAIFYKGGEGRYIQPPRMITKNLYAEMPMEVL